MRNTYLVVGIIVVLIVIVVFAAVRTRLQQLAPKALPPPSPMVEEFVSASKHTPAKTAVVDKVSLAKPGFVAIHEAQDGQLGSLLGSSELLSVGSHENIVLSLSRRTVEGETLFAKLYADNGDGKFEFPGPDEPVKDKSGADLAAQFQVSSDSGFQIPATGLGQ